MLTIVPGFAGDRWIETAERCESHRLEQPAGPDGIRLSCWRAWHYL